MIGIGMLYIYLIDMIVSRICGKLRTVSSCAQVGHVDVLGDNGNRVDV